MGETDMALTAMERSMMPDYRRLRAQVVAHNVLHALEPWIERLERLEEWQERERKDGDKRGRPRTRRDIHEALFSLFFAIGVEVITDADRAAAGLDPRNERGLTEYEMRAMEERRMEAMLRPVPPVIIPSR